MAATPDTNTEPELTQTACSTPSMALTCRCKPTPPSEQRKDKETQLENSWQHRYD